MKNYFVINCDVRPPTCCKKCQNAQSGCSGRSQCVDYAIENLIRDMERIEQYKKQKALNEVYVLKARAARIKISER